MRPLARALLCAFFAAPLAIPSTATAQAYPSRPITLVVPFAPGGTTDIVARIVAARVGAELGQPFNIENKSGGGGVDGALEVVRAAPDGYTLGVATVSTMAANPAINPKIPYDPSRDFTPVIEVASTPNVLAVNPSFPAKDYAGFLAALKAAPGKYSFASSGTGSVTHLQMELFKSMTKTFVAHIPYRGSGPALKDTAAGHVPIIFDNLPSALPFIKEGKLVPIALAAPQRLPALPGVPTFADLGLSAMNRTAFYGICGPKDLPPAIVDRLNEAFRKVLAEADVKKKLEEAGAIPAGGTPAQFGERVAAELVTYRKVVYLQRLKLD